MISEQECRDGIVQWSRSLYERGFSVGSAGNISVKLDDGFIMTPTNSCLGFLDTRRLSKLDPDGNHVSGDKPTKERLLHLAYYQARREARAVVHLHSTYATALSCLADTDPEDAIPPITPYVVMRVGRVPVVPYTRPGSSDAVPLIMARAPNHAALLLGNHGPMVTGRTLEEAVFAAEELEETARLVLLTRGLPLRKLTGQDVVELVAAFGSRSS